MRYFSILVGILIIAAASHVTILATGGYFTPHAPLTIAIACGVAMGSICIGLAWTERRWWLAIFIAVTLLAGEAWAMLSTAERILAARDVAAEPARLLALKRKEVNLRIEKAREVVPATSPRLEAAILAKTKADAAIASDASKKTCVSNCRALLTKAVDDAATEVSAARRELDERRAAQQREITAAQAEVASLPAPKSETPLADKLGVPGWTLDLIAAGLASLSANGLGAALLAYGTHRKKAAKSGTTPRDPAYFNVRHAEPLEATASASLKRPTARKLSVPMNPTEHAAKFGLECLNPSPNGRTPLSQIHAAYLDWCASYETPPLPSAHFGAALAELFEGTPGLEVEDHAGRFFVNGVSLRKGPSRAPALLATTLSEVTRARLVTRIAS